MIDRQQTSTRDIPQEPDGSGELLRVRYGFITISFQ